MMTQCLILEYDTLVRPNRSECADRCTPCPRDRRALLRQKVEEARKQLEREGYSASTLDRMFKYLERMFVK